MLADLAGVISHMPVPGQCDGRMPLGALCPVQLGYDMPDINTYPTVVRDGSVISFDASDFFGVERPNYCNFAYSALAAL